MPWTLRPTLRGAAATLIAALLLPGSAAAQSADDEAGKDASEYAAMAFDAVVIRPLALSIVAVGAAFFVPAAIVSAPGGLTPIREAWEHFVLAPVNFVFRRPLGDF
jgi:hypothetical protein